MTTETDAALRAAAGGATPGPWEVIWNAVAYVHIVPDYTTGEPTQQPEKVADAGERDREFIALANPTAILGLLDRLEAAEAKVARVEALHRPVHWHVGETAEDDSLVEGESHGAKGCMPTRCADRTCGERGSGWPCVTRAALGDPQ